MAFPKAASIDIVERYDADDEATAAVDGDAEFGGPEARRGLERKLIRKIDLRMSILILIYILNYVRLSTPCSQVTSETGSSDGS